MKLRGEKLKALCEANGVSRQDLARAIERTGMKGDRALSAVNNWMVGKDHPRARAEDVRRIAQTVGCEVKDIARFVSMVRFHRGSERKAKLLADLVRGKTFLEADKKTPTGLTGYLRQKGIKNCYLAGLATDFCVGWSAIDARAAGFKACVIEDASRGINHGGTGLQAAWKEMISKGVKRIQSSDIA